MEVRSAQERHKRDHPAKSLLDGPSQVDILRRSCAERIFIDLSACARFALFSDRWGLRSFGMSM